MNHRHHIVVLDIFSKLKIEIIQIVFQYETLEVIFSITVAYSYQFRFSF